MRSSARDKHVSAIIAQRSADDGCDICRLFADNTKREIYANTESIDCTETKDNRHQTIYALGPQKTTGFGNSVMVSIAVWFK